MRQGEMGKEKLIKEKNLEIWLNAFGCWEYTAMLLL